MMKLYKINFDLKNPAPTKLTVDKGSKFAIKLEKSLGIGGPDNGFVTSWDGDYDMPLLKCKSKSGETFIVYCETTIDPIYDGIVDGYTWVFNPIYEDITCEVEILEIPSYNPDIEVHSRHTILNITAQESDAVCDGYEETTIKVSNISNNMFIGSAVIANDVDLNTDNFQSTMINGKCLGGNSVAVGYGAYCQKGQSTAIGTYAKTYKNGSIIINNGLGGQENNILADSDTFFKVGKFPLLNDNGIIPDERLPGGTEENPLRTLIFEDENNSGKKYSIGILNGQLVVTEI